jgi:hypothetical protein
MPRHGLILRLTIYSLLVLTFFLGLPSFHYATALIIGLLIRYKDEPNALFAPIETGNARY